MTNPTAESSTTAVDSDPPGDLLCFPNEVIENILSTLQLTDMWNLRLCSRGLAAKTIQPRFKAFYHSKTIPLQDTALENFSNVTRNSGLGCLVQNITIVGQVEDSGKVPAKGKRKARSQGTSVSADEALALLTVSFENIAAAANRSRTLRSLKLAYSDIRSKIPGKGFRDTYNHTLRRWRPIWQCAATIFHTIVSALETSHLSIQSLQLFNDFDHQRCSLPCSALQTTLDDVRPVRALSALTHLSISVSDAEDSSQLSGLRELLEMSPRLTHLDIHQFSLGFENLPETKFFARRAIGDERSSFEFSPNAQDNLTRLFQHASEANPMPRGLKNIRLDGIHTTDQDLLRFVRRIAPQHITLKHIRLATGNFRSLFDFCTIPNSGSIVHLDLQDLREGEWHVIFDDSGTHSLQRSGSGAPHPIAYRVPHLCQQGGPVLQEQIRQNRYMYGPL
ncbi:hypothetical protein LTR56_019961 [Elasticomyces elasticus]|nr:hypothetical protein LTR56_019961 [Elasticomyces elasticus]KAK3634070.1 hypothetical protein LTR22_019802 [Elasticomyces elasticus]KAK4911155.1 hypothetical protein LTR49_020227 [Elasticomyces elasticus]KAK5747992.1 hypothetical protein LTS12_021921 [Elasticomyces elasticus]